MSQLPPSQRALDAGQRAFGGSWRPSSLATAPGRLELLGNHVDYNGGLVLAGAIDQTVVIAISESGPAGGIDLVANDVSPEVDHFTLGEVRDWRNAIGHTGPGEYTRGVAASLLDRDIPVRSGLQLAIAGNVPLGFGMSSSAALCVSLVLALAEDTLDQLTVVTVAREAEHRSGSPVGAMDQSASVAGGVILFDGRDTSFTAIQPSLDPYVFVVADSGITHALGQSSYPLRVRESEIALEGIRAILGQPLGSLGEVSSEQWDSIRPEFLTAHGATLTARVDHVVSEIVRVRQGVEAVSAADWQTFGGLMTASGRSSDTDYQISHPVVEELVSTLLGHDGVLGSRMMGGGEGGPALALVHRDAVDDIRQHLTSDFFPRHPSNLTGDRLQVAAFGPGARIDSSI
jgi:galactokinase